MIIKINKSYSLALFFYLLVFACALIILQTAWAVILKMLFLPILLVVGHKQVRHSALLRSPTSIVALGLKDTSVEIFRLGEPGKATSCQANRSFVSKDMIAVRLVETIGRKKHNLFLVRSMCSGDDFRVLKRYFRSRTEAAMD